MSDILAQLVVNLKREDPRTGMAQIVVKLKGPDKDKVDAAAAAVGFSQGQYVRTVLVASAEYVLEQLGLEVQETGKFIDLKQE